MVIKAVIDRIEKDKAVLLSEEMGIEIYLPAKAISGACREGDEVCVSIGRDNGLRIISDSGSGD